jgi:GNAT superfamily N-acetyltransferase
MRTITAPLARVLGRRHLRQLLIAATPSPWFGRAQGRRVKYQLDLWIFLVEMPPPAVLALLNADELRAGWMAGHDVVIVVERGEVLGWAVLYPLTEIVEDDARLLSLVVAPAHRRRGVGVRLIEGARRLAGEAPILGSPVDAASERFFTMCGVPTDGKGVRWRNPLS